ncbi:MAG: squalene/phytoene synthase family protein [Chthoniobacterales bacterium]
MTEVLPENLGVLAPKLCRGSNLAFALFILPRAQRENMRIFYAFCRIVDDIADSEILPIEEKRRKLTAWKDAFSSQGLQQLPSDLRKLIQDYDLNTHYFLELIRGVESDLDTFSYKTFEDLRLYCWRVAVTVGLISIRIFGCRHPQADQYAEAAGMALQVTNILRDVREDLERGRIYLPEEDCARFNLNAEALKKHPTSGDFVSLMEFEATRARNYFQQARESLPASERKKLPASELMQKYYSRILDKMSRDNFRVFGQKYRLSKLEKLASGFAVLRDR